MSYNAGMLEPLPHAAPPEYLTDALRRAGALGTDCVSDVVVQSSKATILSRIVRLQLSYDGSAHKAPASLILKTGLPERVGSGWNSGRHEIAFYTQIAAAMASRLFPRSFDAVWQEETNDWHLLLEDLTDTHFVLALWPTPPSREQSERIIAPWARFYAQWWDDPRIGVSIGAWLASHDPQINIFAQEFERFADFVGDRLPSERRYVYERLIECGHRLNERYHSTVI